MKIYVCSPTERESGIGLYANLVARGVRRTGHLVTVGCGPPDRPSDWDVIHLQIGSTAVHMPQVELLRELRRPAIAPRRARPVVVATLHDRHVPGLRGQGAISDLRGRLARRVLGVDNVRLSALQAADATVVLSDVAWLTTPRWLRYRVHQIPHPLPDIGWSAHGIGRGERKREPVTILLPGFFGPSKVRPGMSLVRALESEEHLARVCVGTPHPALDTADWHAFLGAASRTSNVLVEPSGFLDTESYLAQFRDTDLSFIASSGSFDEISAGFAYSVAAATPVIVPDFTQYPAMRRAPLNYPLRYTPGDDRSVAESLKTLVAEYDAFKSVALSVRSEYLRAWGVEPVGDAHLRLYARLLQRLRT